MITGRLWRNKFTFLGMLVTFIFSWFGQVTGTNFPRFDDAISGLIGFSSIATAVFMTALAFVPNFSQGILGVFETDKKFEDRLLITVLLYFWTSVVGVLILFFVPSGSDSNFATFTVSLELSLFVGSLQESLYISYVLLRNNVK
ncbi:hypothetical protein C6P08_09155 [Weissella confusa]|uniref:hypothetical protein n=1 Tax=Weissella confusa TaxID=1583 RepID=UPI0010BB754A|nr:hypothetical protein [Weissella confusa]MBJ7695314.1 hypothetical protein [Weissella confusa]QBZ05347.1 hypothetical protein C6P08_09155 [Weissella confusa]